MEKMIRLGIFVISFILIAMLVQTVTMRKFSALEDKEAMASAEIITAKDRERQLANRLKAKWQWHRSP